MLSAPVRGGLAAVGRAVGGFVGSGLLVADVIELKDMILILSTYKLNKSFWEGTSSTIDGNIERVFHYSHSIVDTFDSIMRPERGLKKQRKFMIEKLQEARRWLMS
jgi:hypothetical protein